MSILKSLRPDVSKSDFDEFSPSTYRHNGDYDPELGGNFTMFNGNATHFNWESHQSSLKAFRKCAPLAAVITRKAQAYINGRTWFISTAASDLGKEAKSKEADKMRKLFANPNPFQTDAQFEAQGYIYEQIFGFNIILLIKPLGFKENIDATSMWNIPPYMIDVEETNKLFYQSDLKGVFSKIILNYAGQRTELDLNNLIIVKDFTPSMTTLILPSSRIVPLEMPINNIIGAYESRNVLINYRGALGVLSHDPGTGQLGSMPMQPGEKEDLQKDFRRYGLSNRQWQIIITKSSLKWQSMSTPTKDLMLFEEVNSNTQTICDVYNYPYRLLSSNTSTSLAGSDIKEYKQLLYQDAIIPESSNRNQQLNSGFNLVKYNFKIDKDYTHIAALQADKGAEATARLTLNEAKKIEFEAGLITMNDWLVALGEDPLPGAIGKRRITDPPSKDTPLALILGEAGVGSLLQIISTTSISSEARAATLEILFRINPADAARMCQPAEVEEPDPNEANNNQNQNPNGDQN